MQVLLPHISCVIPPAEYEAAIAQGFQDIYINMSDGGILRHQKLRGEGRYVRTKFKGDIPGYKQVVPELKEEISFLPAGKIPYVLLKEIIQFFKEVMTIKKAEQEAMAHILWNATRGYHIAIPNQVVSKASAKYDYDHIQQGDVIVLDIHSHNTMGAFFSGTDDSDDKKGIYYSGVVGKLNDLTPALIWRFNVNDSKYEATIQDIFDVNEAGITIPKEWLDKVTTQTYPSYTPGPYNGGSHMGKVYAQDHWDKARLERAAAMAGANNTNPGNKSVVNAGNFENRNQNRVILASSDDSGDPSLWGDVNFDQLHAEFIAEGGAIQCVPDADIIDRLRHVRTAEEARNPKNMPVLVPGQEVVTSAKKRYQDIPGLDEECEDDGLGLARHEGSPGEHDYRMMQYGKEPTEAFEQISAWMNDLEGMDDLLRDLINSAFVIMTPTGQSRMQTFGFK